MHPGNVCTAFQQKKKQYNITCKSSLYDQEFSPASSSHSLIMIACPFSHLTRVEGDAGCLSSWR